MNRSRVSSLRPRVSSLRPRFSTPRSRASSQKLIELELATSNLGLAPSDHLQIKLVLAPSQKLIDLGLRVSVRVGVRVREHPHQHPRPHLELAP